MTLLSHLDCRAALGVSPDRCSFTVTDFHHLPPVDLPGAPWLNPHPMQSLCTLRNHCHQLLRNTRYQADATPYLGRTFTGRIAPACGWRIHSITSSARDRRRQPLPRPHRGDLAEGARGFPCP